MGHRQTDSGFGRFALLILFLMGTISCCMVYLLITMYFRPISAAISSEQDWVEERGEDLGNEGECCKGIEHLELWGDAVKWGTDFRFNSSEDCCKACKAMCKGDGGPCLCNSWVFCGDREACGPRYGEGIVGLETEYGIVRIILFPNCAPQSVAYILELLAVQHCAGCHFYRAEGQGGFWDSNGNHKKNALFGPPFALAQGTFEAHGTIFRDIPNEFCPRIRRGSVAWVGSGPEFFISLANHNEWKKEYAVFGSVLSEDMAILEKISQLPTQPEVWSNIIVSVLEKPVPLQLRRMNTNL